MQVVVVGSGAREHALAWRLAQSPGLTELHAAPGNPGIAAIGRCHPVRADDADGLLSLAMTLGADLVVIGPEGPLVAGIADGLRQNGITVFGPSGAAAQIEGSKQFAKDVLRAAGVPTAETLAVARPPCVVKADGLAAGKGVFVCHTTEEVDEALRAVSALGGEFVIEELLDGEEVSLFALSDGRNVVPFGAAQDFKRIGEGDTGPNTGGMGAYSPLPWLEGADQLVGQIHQPVIDELARRGTPFTGCLFAGVMLTADGPKVLEFNARFGDPETQVVMPLLEGDLLELLLAAAAGDLSGSAPSMSDAAAVTVVLAGPDYPARSDHSGAPISGLEAAEAAGALVFHSGTAVRDGTVVTNGGRILSVTGTGDTVAAARAQAYAAVDLISFEGAAVPPRHRGGGRCLSRWWESWSGRNRTARGCRRRSTSSTPGGSPGSSRCGRRIECRTPWRSTRKSAHERGLKVLICGAGLAAALPGVVAAHTELPVIGVPLRSSMSVLDGLDALLSIVQMPPGVPVATVGVDNAKNAAVLAARILALLRSLLSRL